MPKPWITQIGETLTRAELHETYGASTQGGIAPALASGNIFLFSSASKAEANGYNFDGLSSDGAAFDYTGMGRSGDQSLGGFNGSILRHKERGLRLRLFLAADPVAGSAAIPMTYVGEFHLDESFDKAYRHLPSLGADGFARTAIVFRLLPDEPARSLALTPQPLAAAPSGVAVLVAPEADNIYLSKRPEVGAGESRRDEARLTTLFQTWLARSGRTARRWSITLEDGKTTLVTDLYLDDEAELFEAKASSKRDSVRLAIGQLLDYGRHLPVSGLRRSVLLPVRPAPDLLVLLESLGFGCIVLTDGGEFKRLLAAEPAK